MKSPDYLYYIHLKEFEYREFKGFLKGNVPLLSYHFSGIPPLFCLRISFLSQDIQESIFYFLKKYGDCVFFHRPFQKKSIEDPLDRLVYCIRDDLIARGALLSLAESCTGGALAAALTAVAGASQFFSGSLVSYRNEIKMKLLSVSSRVLEKQGAVCSKVVSQMAQGALDLLETDYSIAVSGIFGPGGASEKASLGTIWVAFFQRQGKAKIWCFHGKGSRKEMSRYAVGHILARFYFDMLSKKPSYI